MGRVEDRIVVLRETLVRDEYINAESLELRFEELAALHPEEVVRKASGPFRKDSNKDLDAGIMPINGHQYYLEERTVSVNGIPLGLVERYAPVQEMQRSENRAISKVVLYGIMHGKNTTLIISTFGNADEQRETVTLEQPGNDDLTGSGLLMWQMKHDLVKRFKLPPAHKK